ncbi:MAG TPA: hypothetical protein VLK65_19400 [Vicinamibacteria bacterium]|nr:hypothetical protein [Vicinamibacteria bacterium]
MPLYDRSYQRVSRARTARSTRVTALARETVKLLLRRRALLALLAFSWIPALVRAVQIYASHQFPQAADFFSVSAAMWQEFLGQQVRLLPVVLVSLYVGAGAIASDFASGAYVLYLSKPISQLDYVAGRALPVLGAICFVTLVPGLALLALELAIAGDTSILRLEPWLPVSIVSYSLWLALYFTILVLSISSLSRSGRVAGAGFAALVLGTEVVLRGAAQGLTSTDVPLTPGIVSAAVDSGHVFFRDASGSSWSSIFVMALSMVVCALILRRRLASSEVVQ